MSLADVDALIVEFRNSTIDAVHQSNATLQEKITANLHQLIAQYDRGVHRKFAVVVTELAGLRSEVEDFRKINRELFDHSLHADIKMDKAAPVEK